MAALTPRGCIAPDAEMIDVDLRLGSHVFIGERVVIARWKGLVGAVESGAQTSEAEGFVDLGDHVQIERENDLEVFEGGYIRIGPGTILQSRCVLLALVQPISIGRRVVVGPYCAFFPYDHQFAPGVKIYDQPLDSKGPIIVEDDVRLGAGVTVLSGVTIGRGAIIHAGAVVTRNIPAGAVAAGAPARVEGRTGMEPITGASRVSRNERVEAVEAGRG